MQFPGLPFVSYQVLLYYAWFLSLILLYSKNKLKIFFWENMEKDTGFGPLRQESDVNNTIPAINSCREQNKNDTLRLNYTSII